MKKITLILSLSLSSFAFAQKINPNDVIGFWKLEEAGYYEDGKKINKDFNNCRLLRNYTIWENGYAIYNYFEGSNENCTISEPRLTFWRIIDNRIQFYIDDYIFQDEIIKIIDNQTITFETYKKDKIEDNDKLFEKIANSVSYEILKKQ